MQVNSRWFWAEKCSPPLLDSEFLVFTLLAGVPFPIASAALPSPSSSIIYVAIARICPEIHTRQSFQLFAPTQSFQSCWRARVLSVGTASVSPPLLTPLCLSQCSANPRASLGCRSAGVVRMPFAVQDSWSRYGRRSLQWQRQARPHRLQQPHPPSSQPPQATCQVRPPMSLVKID